MMKTKKLMKEFRAELDESYSTSMDKKTHIVKTANQVNSFTAICQSRCRLVDIDKSVKVYQRGPG